MIMVTPAWQTQPWYTLLLAMSMQCLLLLTPLADPLLDPEGNKHPLVQSRKLMLAAWNVTGNPLRQKEFKQFSQTYFPFKKTEFYCSLQIVLE